MYADDAMLVETVEDPAVSALSLNSDLASLHSMAKQRLITFNPTKSKAMVFSVKHHREYHPPLYFDNVEIEQVTSHKHLDFTLTSTLSWAKHIENICNMAKCRLGTIRHVSNKLPGPT